MRREQKAVDDHDRYIEAKYGLVESNENDQYDNDEDNVEDDTKWSHIVWPLCGFLLFYCGSEKTVWLKYARRQKDSATRKELI